MKVGSVYTIYTNHPEPPLRTINYDKNNVLPFLAGNDKSTIIINPKTCLKYIVILWKEGERKLAIVTNNRDEFFLISFTSPIVVTQNNELLI